MAKKDVKILELELRITESKMRIKDLKQSITDLDGRTLKYRKAVQALAVEEGKLVKRQGQLATSNKELTNSTNDLIGTTGGKSGKGGKGLSGVSAASGSADASVLEMGRTISDSNYGIRGMANNLSQLVSNLTYTTKKAGSLALGFKALWSSIAGPLGLILAFQGIIALWERYDMKQEEAKRNMKDTTNEFKEQVEQVNAYTNALKNLNLKEEDRLEMLNKISKVSDDFADIVKKNKDNTDDLVDSIKDYIKVQGLRASLDAELIKEAGRQDYFEKALKAYTDGDEDAMMTIIRNRTSFVQKSFAFLTGNTDLFMKIDPTANIKEYFQKKILEPFARQGETSKSKIQDILNQLGDLDAPFGDDKELKEGTIAFFNSMIKPLQKDQEELATTSGEYRKLQREIDNYLAKIYQIKREARGTVDGAVSALVPEGATPVSLEDDPEIQYQKMKAEGLIAVGKDLNSRLEGLRLEEAAKILIKEEFEREQKALTFAHASNLFGLAQGLVEDNKGLQAAFIIAQKGAAIGEMIMDYNIATLANTAHAAGLGPVLGPTYLAGANSLAKLNLVGGIAGATLGAATALSALGKGGSGGSSGSGATDSGRTFDFNLAGSTGQNQLAQTIGGQVQQPIKAYVVSSEITNQQQFDNQIQGEVTIG